MAQGNRTQDFWSELDGVAAIDETSRILYSEMQAKTNLQSSTGSTTFSIVGVNVDTAEVCFLLPGHLLRLQSILILNQMSSWLFPRGFNSLLYRLLHRLRCAPRLVLVPGPWSSLLPLDHQPPDNDSPFCDWSPPNFYYEQIREEKTSISNSSSTKHHRVRHGSQHCIILELMSTST